MRDEEKPSSEDRQLVLLNEAKSLIDKAKTIPELKSLSSKAEAVRAYSKRIGATLSIQNRAAEVKVRAERKAGEMLREMGLRGGDRKSKGHDVTLKLSDIPITRKDSTRWQIEASVPAKVFEQFIANPLNNTGEITSAHLLRLGKKIREQRRVVSTTPTASLSEDGFVATFDDPRVSGQIKCLYLDPPWAYADNACAGGVGLQYPTMTVKQICDLPTWQLLHKDGAHVWMWTTWPMIREGAPHKVLAAWHLRWVGEMVWVKPGLGVGRWLRPSTEVLVFAVCERNLPLRRYNQRGHLEAKRLGHSRKPDEFYALIESLSPGPYLELFARRRRKGWLRWGNEA